jgi:NADPH-dependent curcumin reductase
VNRARIQGFIISDHVERMPEFLRDSAEWLRTGRLKYREDIVDGLERAPEAFIGLLRGQNLGKLIVRVAPDPTR